MRFVVRIINFTMKLRATIAGVLGAWGLPMVTASRVGISRPKETSSTQGNSIPSGLEQSKDVVCRGKRFGETIESRHNTTENLG